MLDGMLDSSFERCDSGLQRYIKHSRIFKDIFTSRHCKNYAAVAETRVKKVMIIYP